LEAIVILAGDVGASKILLEVGEMRSGRWKSLFARRYATSSDFNFLDILREFLDEWEPAKPAGHEFSAAAFGVAGPAESNKVKMTHRPWTVDGDLIARRLAIPRVRVVNDLAAAAHGIDWLEPDELAEIQAGEALPDEPRVVMGVGTGLGVCYRVCIDGKLREVSGEAGHANFAPANIRQVGLWHEIYTTHGRVSAEDVVSGAGIQHVYAYTSGLGAHVPGASEMPAPGEITAGALERSEAKFTVALDLFAECMAGVAGDHAIAVLARGGVYLTGGIVAKITPWLQTDHFRAAFCAKGPLSAMLMRVPVHAVKSERIVVIGAARLASEV
jgi:glucokinase